MHNLRNEPFGISTVEAIAAGCVPIVHNSGGQREIVPFDDLRFNDKIEAVEKVKNLKNLNLAIKIKKMQDRLWHYDTSEFYKKIKQYFEPILSNERNF
jgi:glycogen synthase